MNNFWLSACFLGALAAVTHGATLTVPISSSTLIRNDGASGANQTRNYGGSDTVIVGTTGSSGAILRSLLATSLSSLPAGATITSVTLTLYSSTTGATANTSGSVAMNLHLLTTPFTEGSGDAAGNSTNDATWLNSTTGTNWTTAGGDYNPTILASTSDDPTTAEHTIVFGSTSGLVTAAQDAFNNNTSLSLLLKLNDTNEAQGTTRRAYFYSSDDNATASFRPYFTIEYIPEPSSALLAGSGLGLLVFRRRR